MSAIKQCKTSRYSKEDRKAFPFCYLMILLPVLQFLVFWVFVNVNSIVLAFQDSAGAFSFVNFREVFDAFRGEDMYGWNLGRMLLRTVILWTCVNVICTPLIMFSTYILYKKILGHHIFRTIFAIPSILGAIVWTRLMSFLVSSDGPILEIASQLGIAISPEVMENGLIGTETTAYITLIFINVIPHLIACNLILTGAFSRIPPEVLESARIDGVGFFREFFQIGVPLAWPTIVVTFVSALATLFTADGQVFLYTMGDFETATMGFYLYYMVFRISESTVGANAFGYPAAVGVCLTVMTLPVILLAKYFLESRFETAQY